jgi:hypothetical protein
VDSACWWCVASWQTSTTWKGSTDPEFIAKMHRVLDLYDHPSVDGRVVCVDEFGPLNLQPVVCDRLQREHSRGDFVGGGVGDRGGGLVEYEHRAWGSPVRALRRCRPGRTDCGGRALRVSVWRVGAGARQRGRQSSLARQVGKALFEVPPGNRTPGFYAARAIG